MTGLPDRARVVVVGGGVIGTSVAYHLAHLGCTDVVLLAQSEVREVTEPAAPGRGGSSACPRVRGAAAPRTIETASNVAGQRRSTIQSIWVL